MTEYLLFFFIVVCYLKHVWYQTNNASVIMATLNMQWIYIPNSDTVWRIVVLDELFISCLGLFLASWCGSAVFLRPHSCLT